MCGQGKLYVRLNVIKDVLIDDEQENILMKWAGGESCNDESEIVDVCNVSSISSSNSPQPPNPLQPAKSLHLPNPAQPPNPPQLPVINVEDQEPSTLAGHSFFDESLTNLSAVFPEEDPDIVRDVLMRYEDVDIAAQALSDKIDITIVGVKLTSQLQKCSNDSRKEWRVKAVLKS